MIRLTIAVSVTLLLFSGFLAFAPGMLQEGPNVQETSRSALPGSLEDIVSRAATPIAPDPEPVVPPLGVPVEDVAGRVLAKLANTGIEDMRIPNEGLAAAPGPDLTALTETVVSSLEATGLQQPSARASSDLSGLIVQALAETDSDRQLSALLDTLVNEAASDGRLIVPAALRTAEGRVDTRTLLNDIVRRASTVPIDGQSSPSETLIATQTPVARPRPQEDTFYTVQSGDSLGAIAQRHYGDASLFTEIYRANRGSLNSPNRIRVGQRLLLPKIGV